ncbi:AAA family ATPase [Mesorhizobium sp. M0514]|uniref:AAA family ATPase n=1 Tax=Mesorhizobium sp. M0514 TaxID=2956955 RepID=UPI00333BD45B
MRYVDRNSVDVPAYFRSDTAQSARGVLHSFLSQSPERLVQERAPILNGAIESSTILETLTSLFKGKCAFCESRLPLKAHRFRPPADASPSKDGKLSHLYYVWLVDEWANLYPICESCHPEPGQFFPVWGRRAPFPDLKMTTGRGADDGSLQIEKPLWLDPCADSISPHLTVRPDGAFESKSRRGTATIAGFHLDRPALVASRTRAFASRLAILAQIVEGTSFDTLPPETDPFDFDVGEHSGTWNLLLHDLCAGISRRVRQPGPSAGTPAFFGWLAQRADGRKRLTESINALSRVAGKARQPKSLEGDAAALPAVSGPKSLASVRVRDFKGLADLTVKIPKPTIQETSSNESSRPVPSLLILGENSAGKSSILEALALAMIEERTRQALKPKPARKYVLDPAYMGDQQAPPRPRAIIDITFQPDGRRTLDITKEGFSLTSMPHTPQVFAYGAYRHYLEAARPPSSVETLFHSNWVLSNPEKWLLRLPQSDFDMVVRTLRVILSIEGDFEVIEREPSNKRCMMVQSADTPGTATLRAPLDTVSSGYRSVLAMACDILRGLMDKKLNPGFVRFEDACALVLIDEVEAHLHPRWKMQIMRALRKALPNVTFIATTHDPLCLRGMADGEVLVLQRVPVADRQGDDLPVMVESLVELPVSNLTIEQLLTSDLFSLFSTDSPDTERKFAEVSALLALAKTGKTLEPEQQKIVDAFLKDITQALPIGATDVHRLVQEAVVEYMNKRRLESKPKYARLESLRQETKTKILAALRTV